jgi:putative oxidoreductase
MVNRVESRVNSLIPVMLSAFRIVCGFLFACHGSAILFDWPVAKPPSGDAVGWLAGFIEFVTGVLVVVGACTRIAAFLASGTMAFAYFTVHQKTGLLPMQNNGELAALYCWMFILLVFIGGGQWSIDAAFATARRRKFVQRVQSIGGSGSAAHQHNSI